MSNYDIIIVGGGPAGSAAALFAANSNYKTLLLHRGSSPGLADFRWLIPGLVPEMSATQWMGNLQSQVQKAGVDWTQEGVKQASLGNTVKQIATESGKTWEAPVVILAAGCHDRQGLIDGEGKLSGRGVSYNAIQDGFQYKNQPVALEGKNEQAVKEALYLSRFVEKLFFIVPAARLEGEARLLDLVQHHPKIECLFSASLKKIEGDNAVTQVTVLSAGAEKTIPVRAVFLYSRIGKPMYEYLKGTVDISEQGSVLVDERFMTSINGVFACGDIIAGQPQMAFVAAAQGLVAGMNAVQYLLNL